MADIVLSGLTKVYGDGTRALSEMDMEIADGECVVFVGPSGCGKSTALRMIAGLEEVTGGTIAIGGEVVNDLEPRDRDIAMIFQNYALYPQMTAYENMAFGLRRRKLPKAEIDTRVRRIAETLEISELLKKRPRAMSGGQRQRIAMGRAMVREPRVFLMDEPLSNIDAKLRVRMRAEVARIQREAGVTTVYVTHDQSEAMTLGHRVAVMRHGVLQQLDTPQQVYDRPVNLFVAGFIGSPAMNFMHVSLHDDDGRLTVRMGEQRLRLRTEPPQRRALEPYLEQTLVVGIRPEDVEDAQAVGEAPDAQRLDVEVELTENMGSEVYVHCSGLGGPVDTAELREAQEDEDVGSAISGAFVARVSRASRVREGTRHQLVVDPDKLHFFDARTGSAIATT